MKVLPQLLFVIVLLFVLYWTLATTMGLLFYVAVALGIATLLILLIRHLFGDRQPDNKLNVKSHRRAEKEAERKLREMERNINRP